MMRCLLACLVWALLSGCAARSSDVGESDVAALVKARTGGEHSFGPRDANVELAVRDWLSQELTAQRAARVAMLNNPSLAATYEDLGIAQAELLAAGLLENPVLSATARLPDGGGRANLELGLSHELLSIVLLPLRKKLAAAQFELAKLRVAQSVLELDADVRAAFYTLQAAQQMLEMRQTVVESADAAYLVARRLHDAGNITDLELAQHQASLEEARLELAAAESAIAPLRERLIVLMGLDGLEVQWTLSPRLPDLPGSELSLDGMEALAERQRLDLNAAQQEVEVSAAALGLARPLASLLHGEVGVEAERETDGQWLTGPSIEIPLPLFNRGKARRLAGEARLRQAQRQYRAKLLAARSEVRAAFAALSSARQRAAYYQQVVLPLRQRILEQTQRQYNAMLIGVFELLVARAAQVETGRAYLDALRDYWIARVELEKAVGGRIELLSEPATMPATIPAMQPAPPAHEHHHHGD